MHPNAHVLPHILNSEITDYNSLQFPLNAAGIGVWDVKLNGTWTFACDDYCRNLLGIAKDQIVTYENAIQRIHTNDRNSFTGIVNRALDADTKGNLEMTYRLAEDPEVTAERWVRFIGKAYFNDAGIACRISGVVMDVTAEKRPAERSALSENLAKIVLKGTGVGVFHINLNNDHIDYSPAFAVILTGETNTNLVRADFINHIHPEDRLSRKAAYEAALQSGDLHYEARTVWNDGSIHWIRTVGTYSFDASGRALSFSGTVQDITQEREKVHALKEAEDRFSFAIRQSEAMFRNVTSTSPAGLWMSNQEGLISYLNKTLIDWTGRSYESLSGMEWTNIICEDDRQLAEETFKAAIAAHRHFDLEFRMLKGNGDAFWCRGAGDPYYLEDGSYAGYIGFCMDIDTQVIAAQNLKLSEERIAAIIEQAPLAIGLLNGREMVVSTVNEAILKLWGKNKSIIGKPIIEALPEIKDQPFLELLEKVYDTGVPYFGYSTLARLKHQDSLQEIYFDFVYTPIRDSKAVITGVMVLAIEVTPQVLYRKAVEESEAKFRGLIEEAPFATALYTGRELIIEMANEAMIGLWRKDTDIIGMPLGMALPELQGQHFLDILNNIFDTGLSYHRQDARADLLVDGELRTFYFNFTYKPIKNETGDVYAILNMAVDVTQQVLARQKIQEAEESLRGAVELAELGTWHIDLETGVLDYSDRLRKWFGFTNDELVTPGKVYALVAEKDRRLMEESMTRAINAASKSIYDVEYTVTDKISGKERIIHAQGRAFFDEADTPYKVSGTAQDVTEQRKVQTALEQEVLRRTEQLHTLNAEFKSANDELFKSNERLLRSNEELAQFAYVASHDLQEPLRKIRTFSSMLTQQNMTEESKRPVSKIIESAERMSMLIQDLLEFSRLLKAETLMRPIELSEVCKAVNNDFELSILEKNAEIRIGKLPVIEAVRLQMNQLFYNLLSNALKFSSPDIRPRVDISSRLISIEEVKRHLPRPNMLCQYYQITIADNGIGFDVKYSEQIFEVFKRLHGRDVYPGSGIGLALCRRIVANHKGYLYAESEPGHGAAFHIVLPDRNMESAQD